MKTNKGNFKGYVAGRINGYKIVEGIGPYGGEWMARCTITGHCDTAVFLCRDDAEQHARLSRESEMNGAA